MFIAFAFAYSFTVFIKSFIFWPQLLIYFVPVSFYEFHIDVLIKPLQNLKSTVENKKSVSKTREKTREKITAASGYAFLCNFDYLWSGDRK